MNKKRWPYTLGKTQLMQEYKLVLEQLQELEDVEFDLRQEFKRRQIDPDTGISTKPKNL
jgi:hypothetical protein